MQFQYQAKTKEGIVQRGIIEASSKETAISILQRHGLYVTMLEEVIEVPFYARRIKFLERVSRKELVLFFRQLSLMFGAEVTLLEALRTLASQTKNPNFKEKILAIADEIEGGSTLSSALSKYPQVFSSFCIAMVKSGEVSGRLSEVLGYLANYLEREYYWISRLRGAMIYPALVFFVASIVLALVLFFVVPQLTEILKGREGELPGGIKFLISLSVFLKEWGLIFISIFVILIVAIFYYYQTEAGKKFFERFFLNFPFLGDFLKLIYLSRVAENLSTLISAGLPISQSLEITGKVVGNSLYQEIIFQARDEVRKGESISQVFSRFPEFFPPVFSQMVLVGETSGVLEKSLRHLVGFYQKEIERIVENFLSILGPLLIIFLGVVVGGIIIAFLMPLYYQLIPVY